MHVRTQKIRIYPNKPQEQTLLQAIGTARYVYNWGLDAWLKQYEEFKKGLAKRPRILELSRRWTREKPEWAKQVFSGLQTKALLNLGEAWENFFGKRKGKKKPVFKKKGKCSETFYVSNDKARIRKGYITLPYTGKLRLSEDIRFPEGRPLSFVVIHDGERWFVAIRFELPEPEPSRSESVVGVDVGLKTLAVASDGTTLENPKLLKKSLNKLRYLNKQMARQTMGSNRREKTRKAIKKLFTRISDVRKDSIHKFTAALAKKHGLAVVEDLDVAGMSHGFKSIRRGLQDSPIAEIRRQLEYKMRTARAPRFYPSSKTCSRCGYIDSDLQLRDRVFRCDSCGLEVDRDFNASINLKNMRWVTAPKHAEGSGRKAPVKREANKGNQA